MPKTWMVDKPEEVKEKKGDNILSAPFPVIREGLAKLVPQMTVGERSIGHCEV